MRIRQLAGLIAALGLWAPGGSVLADGAKRQSRALPTPFFYVSRAPEAIVADDRLAHPVGRKDRDRAPPEIDLGFGSIAFDEDDLDLRLNAPIEPPDWADVDGFAATFGVGGESDMRPHWWRVGAGAAVREGPFALTTEIALGGERPGGPGEIFGGVAIRLDF